MRAHSQCSRASDARICHMMVISSVGRGLVGVGGNFALVSTAQPSPVTQTACWFHPGGPSFIDGGKEWCAEEERRKLAIRNRVAHPVS